MAPRYESEFHGLALYARLVLEEELPWAVMGRAVTVSAALLWTFVGLGLLISTVVRTLTRGQTYVLLTYAAGIALLDFALVGMMLQWRLKPEGVFVLAALNPVEAARLALLSAAEPELSVLGPVGFFLATRLGPERLFALGVAWLVVVAAEMIAVNSGLGYLIIDARNAGKRYDLVVAGMVLIGLIGLALDQLVRRLESFDEVRWGIGR